MDDIAAEIIGTKIPKLQDLKLRQEDNLLLVRSCADNNRKIISLNEDATRILSLCDGYNDINTIALTIAKQRNLEFKTVRNEALKLIRSLEGADIVTTKL